MIRGFLRFLSIVVLIAVCLGMGLAGGVVLDRQLLAQPLLTDATAASPTPTVTVPADTESDFRLMREAWDRIEESYVDRPAVDDERLTYGAISGMVDALGDTGHSRFLSPEMVQAQHDFASGQLEGIGAYVEMKDDHLVIVAPMDGTPAQQAGLRPGDVILQVDGENVVGLPIDQVIGRILGPAGTRVALTILTPDSGQTREVTLTRAHIILHNVVWQRLPGTNVAHLRIIAFSKGVTDDLKQALTAIHQQGLTGIVLDLRSNPGGLLGEAVGVASQFLGSGNVLLEQDSLGKVTPVPVKDGGLALDTPLIVLVNQGTASAAEIVSGALQDGGRARLVGETTFGTGTVLNEFRLSDGSALLLATEEWLTPKGRLIWHEGIAPDEVVVLPTDNDLLLPEAEAGMTPQQLQASGDAQLLRALALLTGESSVPPVETSPQTVTLNDEGRMITMKVGESFLLKLGEEYDWTVTIANQTILSRAKNVMVVRGAQGLYEASKTGNTTLAATGDPVCRQSQPSCAMPSRLFEIKVEVQ
jgi:carboxyl-terminal processing protease